MKVVSPYLAEGPDELVDNHPLLSELWRCVFGRPYRGADPSTSFFPTVMSARLLACWTEDTDDRDLHEPVYRTFIFGGTVNDWWAQQPEPDPAVDRAAVNRTFLDLQMAAVTKLIGAQFGHLGFATT